MKFDLEALEAQGAEIGNHSAYLSGFSFAVLLSAAEIATRRYMWTDMEDSEWDSVDALVSRMTEELFNNIMIGTVIPFMGNTIPEYLLLCDGGTYSREDYPNLYSILPASLIVNADEFTLPDMAGLAAVGATIEQPLLSVYGTETHTLSEAEMPIHSHTYTPPTLNLDLEDVGVPDIQAAGLGLPTQTGTAGGGEAHNNMQPSISLYWCVVAR